MIEKVELDELEEINKSIKHILDQKDQILKDRSDLSEKILTVTRQLEIIDRILTDPSYIEKVEDLSNPFKPGNFKNLTFIASVLKTGGDGHDA